MKYILFLALILTAAAPIKSPYAVVGEPGAWGVTHTRIQDALDGGATRIIIRPGTYTETLTINSGGVTIEGQGAALVNTGDHTSIAINAPDVTVQGDLTIRGANDGGGEGDFFQGVGVSISAPDAHIDGLKTRDLRSFSVLIATSAAHHTVIEHFDFRNVATDREAQAYAPAAIMLINGTSYNTVRDGYISGHSQGVGTWYGASYNTVSGNRLENNWGYQGAGAGLIPRSAIEDYGVPDAVNTANRFINNRIDGARSAGFELADVLIDTLVSGNEVRNVHSGFVAQGSGDNKGLNITVESNHFYGGGDGDDHANWFSGSGTIRDNHFIDWQQDNIGTIYIPGGALGDVEISGNTFTRNARVMRASQTEGTLRFMDNRILDSLPNSWMLYFADTIQPAEIAGNVFESGGGGYAIAANQPVPLWVHDNQIQGHVNISAGVIESNRITANAGAWQPVSVHAGMVVRDNRIHSDTPFAFQDGAPAALVERNYYTRTDGSAAPPLNCPATMTCSGNWTAGQVPP